MKKDYKSIYQEQQDKLKKQLESEKTAIKKLVKKEKTGMTNEHITLGTYIMDISEKSEKTILNKLEKELTEKIEYRKDLGLNDRISERMLVVVKERKDDIKEYNK
ncbi:MAG: hypothetical protein LIR50_05580 [Bacillota bacterium]|nr:hypothetical protein [Bacillota bacterium]